MNKLEIQNNEIKINITVENIIEEKKLLLKMNKNLDENKREYELIDFISFNRVSDEIPLLNIQINKQDTCIFKDIKASELQNPLNHVPLRQGS